MALPLLPGNSFNKNVGKEKFFKPHYFDTKNDVSFLFNDDKCGIGGDPFPGQRIEAPTSKYPNGEGTAAPAWIAFDKQVLSFDAYYQEAVHERREEQYRVRCVKIFFYLEDDTIQVIEPRNKNTGLPQGTLIRRHRISRPAPNNALFYTVDDFNVGIEIELYGKVFRITSCDEFTHNFLRKLGVKVGVPEKSPMDKYTEARKSEEEAMQPLRPYERHDTLRQFLDNDRQVLRFFCFWDDTDNLYGDAREMILHYFLSDDTIEIREIIKQNSGRDGVPCFLKRAKVPKHLEPMLQPGKKADRTLLNVVGHPQKGGRYILDSLKTGATNIEYYKDSDLQIGTYINVYGRRFLICDMDEFTKEFYSKKYNITNTTPVSYTLPSGQRVYHQNPPYNGFGGEEDSLQNCKGLVPEPPRRDFIKFMEKDRRGLQSNILRFKAQLVTDKKLDQGRMFIISYFLSDDSMLIFEPVQNNSGLWGGKFLERGQIKLPGQERYGTELPKYYQAKHLYVGAQLKINNFVFLLTDADEYAYRYMEINSNDFPYSNIYAIMGKLKRALSGSKLEQFRQYFVNQDINNSGKVNFQQLVTVLRQVMEGCEEFVNHEIATVARYYCDRPVKELNIETVAGIIQNDLRKKNFDEFQAMREAANLADKSAVKGEITPKSMFNICQVIKLPIQRDLVRSMIGLCQNQATGNVDYNRFITHIDWRKNPISYTTTGTNERDSKSDPNASWTTKDQAQDILYKNLIEDLSQ